jgi:hypothetical protein
MTYATLLNYNMSAGLHIPFCYVNDISTGLFSIMLLLMIWGVVSIGGYFVQKRNVGSGDFAAWNIIGSFAILIITIFFRMLDCPNLAFISNITLAVVIAYSLLSFIYMIMSVE